jgi:hypothetical protein
MPETTPNLAAKRAELEAVLASSSFARAPSLGLLLSYICEKDFSGEHHLIKEYNIAVEALGRPADFDQKKDSIVRVEAHRLRKRLKLYYEGEGSDHPLQIELPLGGYAPLFKSVESTPALEEEPVTPVAEALSEPSPVVYAATPKQGMSRTAMAVVALAVVGSALLLYSAQFRQSNLTPSAGSAATKAEQPPSGSLAVDLAASANVSEIRISAGSSTSFIDAEGHVWFSDRYFQGGKAVSDPKLDINGTLRPMLYQSWREGSFTYRIPLKEGVYQLTLYFCEPTFSSGADNSRTFSISINGHQEIREFDILTDTGAEKTANARTWKDVRPGKDGFLTLEFVTMANPALLQGIEIQPGTPGRIRPIRVAAREEPYTDTAGRVWSQDRFFSGGKLVKRIEGIQNTEEPELYRGERFGRLTYTIPVAPDSTYTAILHFAETWFAGAGPGREGSRLFDILCNGLILQRNFDVYHEAGGPFKALNKVYKGLKPTPNGKLVFQFVPSKNYAFVNALEILDESQGETRTSGVRPVAR